MTTITRVLFLFVMRGVNLQLGMVQQYEKAYFDAREVLHFRGKKVARPNLGEDGLRYCPVDGSPLTDRGVFKEAWGETLADEILRERVERAG